MADKPRDERSGDTMRPPDDAAPAPEETPPRRSALLLLSIPRPWLLGMVAAIVVALGIATAGFALVNDDRTCGVCHVIKKEVTSYKTTAHSRAGVTCQDCHTKPGVFNYFIRNLQSTTHIIEYISGHYEQPITTYVGVESCVGCHPKSQIEQDLIAGDIRVNHKGLREAGFQCVTCHASVAHGNTVPVGSRPPQSIMAICATCHNGVIQPKRCSICHLNGVPKGTAQITMPLHMAAGNCRDCHTQPNFCTRCHDGLQMPHPSGWLKTHGPLAVQRGQQICASCHTDKHPDFCVNCHGLQMPHPAGWTQGHGSVALATPQVCTRCHGVDSCVRCHGLQLPHPSSFIASHFTYAASEGSICVKCHGNGGSGPTSCFGGDCHSQANGAPH